MLFTCCINVWYVVLNIFQRDYKDKNKTPPKFQSPSATGTRHSRLAHYFSEVNGKVTRSCDLTNTKRPVFHIGPLSASVMRIKCGIRRPLSVIRHPRAAARTQLTYTHIHVQRAAWPCYCVRTTLHKKQ